MYARTTAKAFRCKMCQHQISASDLDEIYQEYLKGYLSDINPTHYINEADTLLKEKEQLLLLAEQKRKHVKRKMDELVPLRLNGELSKEHFAELYKPLEQQAVELDQSIPELQAEVDFRRIQIASSDVILSEARTLYEKWAIMEFEEKRAIIETITEHVIIGKEDITISLCYLPSFEMDEKGNATGTLRCLFRFTQISPKPLSKRYIEHPKTLGEHLLKRRLDLQLTIREVAALFHTSTQTVRWWENDKKSPRIQQHKNITAFLGYSLWVVDTSTLAGRIREYRHRHGLSAKKFAGLVGVSETVIFKWEFERTTPTNELKAKLISLLETQSPLE